MDSQICSLELDHALKLNKRIIPLVRVEAEQQKIPEPMRALNWIHFRESDPFDESFEKLLLGIETDLEWVKAHTRYLQKSLEWQRSGHRRSSLIRGKNLQEAEQWLSSSAGKDPQPLPLQREFLRKSRRWQRNLRTTVAASLAIVMAVALIGWWQYGIQTEIALIEDLIANAAPDRKDLQHSTLLAIEALRRSMTLKRDSQDAEAVLRKNLRVLPDLLFETSRPGRIARGAQLSPDGKLVAAFVQKTVWIWDWDSGQEYEEDCSDRVMALAFHPGSRRIAVGSRDGAITVFGLPGLDVIQQIPTQIRPLALAYAPGHSPPLLAAALDKSVEIWQESDGLLRPIDRRDFEQRVTTLAFSPGGTMLAVALLHDDLRSEIVIESWQQPGSDSLRKDTPQVQTISFSPDSRRLITGGAGDVQIWEIEASRIILDRSLSKGEVNKPESGRPFTTITSAVSSASFNEDGTRFAIALSDSVASVHDSVNPQKELSYLHHSGIVTAVAYIEGDRLVTLSSSSANSREGSVSLKVWDASLGDKTAPGIGSKPQSLIDRACSRLDRNLTLGEWRQRLGDREPRPTCENLPPPSELAKLTENAPTPEGGRQPDS